MLLIQGVFFQDRQFLTTAYLPKESLCPVVGHSRFYSMFAGSLWIDPKEPSQLIGGLMDEFGDSLLSSVEMSKQSLRFKKKYLRREYVIDYDFVALEGGIWEGKWKSIPSIGEGTARCILTQIPSGFLNQDHL
jgi:hypothetical protein